MLKHLFSNEKRSALDDEIDEVLTQMQTVGVTAEEYPDLLTILERLHKLKQEKKRQPVSRETIALITGNLVGILLIVAYEEKRVITSKGLSHIIRPKSA